ncbi:MAG TPA: hypothetical protein VHO94_06200 [Oscillospiraceae bacterium]|nr:hypothetical protein [Oscillospiraceae bacterium]
MLYCAKCQLLCESACPCCGSEKLREVQQNDPVLLTTVNELECDRITALLQDNDIPYEERVSGLESEPSVLFGRYENTNKNIFVPYDKLQFCEDMLACGELPDEEIAEENSDFAQSNTQPEEESEVNSAKKVMGRRSKIFWRATSVVLFILLIWAVVAGTDFAAAWLKDLFH